MVRSAQRVTAERPMIVTFGSVLKPDGGLQVRSRILAESLAALGRPAAIVSTREPGPRGEVPSWARSLHVPSSKPTFGFSRAFSQTISEVAADSDVVFLANALFMPALTLSRTSLPMIWDTNECQALHYARLPLSPGVVAKRLTWSALERWAARRCTLAVAIGSAEEAAWRRIYPALRPKIMTVNHVPFTGAATGPLARADLEHRVGAREGDPILLFVGTLTAKHNLAAARWIVDVLAPSLPESITVVLCGRDSNHIHGGGKGGRVVGLGAVEDIDSVIAAADLCLAPLASGAGVKTKVLHYLAHRRRVAGTAVAFEGLDGAPGLFEASLRDLPGLVGRLASTKEPPGIAAERAQAQVAWMATRHGRTQAIDQWRAVLERLTAT